MIEINWYEFSLVILIIFISGYLLSDITEAPCPDCSMEYDLSCPQVDCPRCPDAYLECEKWQIQELAEEIAELRPYEKHVWDCSDMSNQLDDLYDIAGYDSDFRVVTYDGNLHSVVKVCVDVEATSGKIIKDYQWEDGPYEVVK